MSDAEKMIEECKKRVENLDNYDFGHVVGSAVFEENANSELVGFRLKKTILQNLNKDNFIFVSDLIFALTGCYFDELLEWVEGEKDEGSL